MIHLTVYYSTACHQEPSGNQIYPQQQPVGQTGPCFAPPVNQHSLFRLMHEISIHYLWRVRLCTWDLMRDLRVHSFCVKPLHVFSVWRYCMKWMFTYVFKCTVEGKRLWSKAETTLLNTMTNHNLLLDTGIFRFILSVKRSENMIILI